MWSIQNKMRGGGGWPLCLGEWGIRAIFLPDQMARHRHHPARYQHPHSPPCRHTRSVFYYLGVAPLSRPAALPSPLRELLQEMLERSVREGSVLVW